MSKRLLAAIALCAMLCPTALLAQQKQPGRITGKVFGESGPLIAAGVTVRQAADSIVVANALTSSDGGFRVDGLAYGKYTLRISYVGYKTRNIADITLTPAIPVLELGTLRMDLGMITRAPATSSGAQAPRGLPQQARL